MRTSHAPEAKKDRTDNEGKVTRGYETTYGKTQFLSEAQQQAFDEEWARNTRYFAALLKDADPKFVEFHMARLPGDGRTFQHLVKRTEELGMTHFGWDYEFGTNEFLGKRGTARIGWQGIKGIAAEPGARYPADKEVVLFHDRHWKGANNDKLDQVLDKLEEDGASYGKLSPASKKCE
jgi:hypothetical protein